MARASADAFEAGVRALARSDLSTATLEARLERAGFGEPEREQALRRLRELGYLDDARVAHERARRLAARGAGDAAIRADLAGRGVPDAAAAEALAGLDRETERAAALVARLGPGRKASQTLARKGFSAETIESVLAVAEDAFGELG
jgi:regulatory protein